MHSAKPFSVSMLAGIQKTCSELYSGISRATFSVGLCQVFSACFAHCLGALQIKSK